MPIEKTSPTLLKHHGGTYVVIPSETIQAIKISDALAILAYLLDKPTDWVIRPGDIRKRFSLGETRYARAMRELHALGLAWKEIERGEGNIITGSHLCVRASVPPEIPRPGFSRTTENTGTRENPEAGESGSLHRTDLSTQDKDGPAEQSAGPRRLQPDWYPSDQLLERAVELGMQFDNFDGIVAEFRDYWISTGKRRKLSGWDRTFMNRLKAITQQQGQRNGKAATSTDIFAADLQEQLKLG